MGTESVFLYLYIRFNIGIILRNLDKIMKSSFFWDKASLIQARPRYENDGRVGVLNEIFGSRSLSESSKPLITLCYDIEKRTHVIHSSHRTPEITFIDAVSS